MMDQAQIAKPLGACRAYAFNVPSIPPFAFRIPLGPAVIAPGVLFVLGVAAGIVAGQTFRASRVNPVHTIHYE